MHRSARSSRARASNLPSAVPEVATAFPIAPSQAASSSLSPTTITSAMSTPTLVASTLASPSSSSSSLLYASSMLTSPIVPAKVASPSWAPTLLTLAVLVQRLLNRDQHQIFRRGFFHIILRLRRPPLGSHDGSASNHSPGPQWPATTPVFHPHRAS